MKNPVPFLLACAGHYRGHGINHANEPFQGDFTITPVLSGRGLQIAFKATGNDGTVYHEEFTTIAPSLSEEIHLTTLNTNMPGQLTHVLREAPPELGAKQTYAFAHGDPKDRESFREEIALSVYANGDIGYRYSWGLPGGEFAFRSSVRMKRWINRNDRPACIQHWSDHLGADDCKYPGSEELLSYGAAIGKMTGLAKIGVHHEVLPPGRRTSWPHAESLEEEFVYILKGHPEAWIDGRAYPLEPGDAVGFPAGTGIAHTFINNSNSDAHLIVLGEAHKPENKVLYPLHPRRNEEMRAKNALWEDAPAREIGTHTGLPSAPPTPGRS